MHTLSTRTLAALAYERGEEFDPAVVPTAAMVEDLSVAAMAGAIVSEPADTERRRLCKRERRAARRVPEWFSACDLVGQTPAGASGTLVHGEPV